MELETLAWIAVGYVAMSTVTGWLAYRNDFSDEIVILCAFFWPLAIPILLFGLLVCKVDEIMWERQQPPKGTHPTGRVIEHSHQRHAPPGDPDHWGSE